MRSIASFFAALFFLLSAVVTADAKGTIRIQQADGTVHVFKNANIRLANKTLTIVSSDRKGTILIEKAACSLEDQIIKCYPYAATLRQGGRTREILMQSGTLYANLTTENRTLPLSSTQLTPRGIMFAMRTQGGSYVALRGEIDEVSQ